MKKKEFQNIVWEMVAIFFRVQCVKTELKMANEIT